MESRFRHEEADRDFATVSSHFKPETCSNKHFQHSVDAIKALWTRIISVDETYI